MLNSPQFQDLSNKIKDIVNSSPLADVDKNVNALIKGALTKMELVTREEFDVLRSLGVRYMQGYWLARPALSQLPPIRDISEMITAAA